MHVGGMRVRGGCSLFDFVIIQRVGVWEKKKKKKKNSYFMFRTCHHMSIGGKTNWEKTVSKGKKYEIESSLHRDNPPSRRQTTLYIEISNRR